MKFSNKRQQYEASNVTFNANNLEAYSYGWWKFVSVINDKVVFNNATYSNTTSKHQSKVRRLMSEKAITIDLMLQFTNKSLSLDSLQDEIRYTKDAIKELELILTNPRRKKSLDVTRLAQIGRYLKHIKAVELVLYGTELNAALQ
jgi:hypothetical protein